MWQKSKQAHLEERQGEDRAGFDLQQPIHSVTKGLASCESSCLPTGPASQRWHSGNHISTGVSDLCSAFASCAYSQSRCQSEPFRIKAKLCHMSAPHHWRVTVQILGVAYKVPWDLVQAMSLTF